MTDYYVPQNKHPEEKVCLSPSGKYRLVVERYSTGPNTWRVSQGLVYNVETNALIATIRRNYSAFPFNFIEGHPKGDFLVCGESYMSQTIVDLATGEKRNTPDSDGFCWADSRYVPDAQLLIVDGCYWAAPYEFRFYDFSDPMAFTELKLPSYVIDDPEWPTVEADGLIKTYQTVQIPEEDLEDDQDEYKQGEFAAYTTFRRENGALVVHEEWVSEAEQVRRKEEEEGQRRYEEAEQLYKATDPLFLEHLELVKDPKLSPENYCGMGFTYEGWCPGLALSEGRVSRRILKSTTWTVDLEWAKVTGPIKLKLYKDGKEHETKFFMEHSVESLRQAVEYAKGVACG